MLSQKDYSKLGSHIFGMAAIALGLVGLIWGDFANVWQPVPATVPHRALFAYLYATLLLLAGAAMQFWPAARIGAVALAVLYSLPAALWARRVFGFPGMIGTWGGLAEELALIAAAVAAFVFLTERPSDAAKLTARIACIVFGLCFITIGAEHFLALKETAALVPHWIPPSGRFWGVFTGVAHVLAGLAILSGVMALLAARLLTAMIFVFGVLVWLPAVYAQPHVHMMWSANAINLALLAAAWTMADAIAARREQKRTAEVPMTPLGA